jgi:hypothetical protein
MFQVLPRGRLALAIGDEAGVPRDGVPDPCTRLEERPDTCTRLYPYMWWRKKERPNPLYPRSKEKGKTLYHV